jgi:hypothetical protein
MGQLKELLIDAEDAVRQVGKFIGTSPLVALDGHVDGLWYDAAKHQFYITYVVELPSRRLSTELHRFRVQGEQVTPVTELPQGLFELSEQIPDIMEVLNSEGA